MSYSIILSFANSCRNYFNESFEIRNDETCCVRDGSCDQFLVALGQASHWVISQLVIRSDLKYRE